MPSPRRRGCAPSPGLHAGPPLSADQDAQRQGEFSPHPLPAGPTVSPQPSFPQLTDLPEAVGPRRVSLPQPQGPGVPLLLHPQLSPSLMFTNGARPPTGLSQGPGAAVRCLGAVSTPPPLALPTGNMGGRASLSDSRWAHPPLFRGTKASDGEGWEPFRPVQGRLVRVKVNQPVCYPLLPGHPPHGVPRGTRVPSGHWAAWEGSSASLELPTWILSALPPPILSSPPTPFS